MKHAYLFKMNGKVYKNIIIIRIESQILWISLKYKINHLGFG